MAPLQTRRSFVGAAAAALGGAGLGLYGFTPEGPSGRDSVRTDELKALDRATAWLNSPALGATALRGKVVLIDVCTYTCINWLRTLPYVREWDRRYREHGLVVIGVHAPEFAFERNVENVRRAVQAMRIAHPLALDNDFAIWRAFNNRYWPSRYLIDANGRIRHHHFGEGEYGRSERMIQELLTETGARGVGDRLSTVEGQGIEAAPDWSNLKSPENYLGYERTTLFASAEGMAENERRRYTAPQRLRRGHWALSGEWTARAQSIRLAQSTGRIHCTFHARDVHLVMGPTVIGAARRFRVTLDGAPPGAARGSDVGADGNGVVTDQRLYQLIRQPGAIDDRRIEIEFLDAGAEAFAFTFG